MFCCCRLSRVSMGAVSSRTARHFRPTTFIDGRVREGLVDRPLTAGPDLRLCACCRGSSPLPSARRVHVVHARGCSYTPSHCSCCSGGDLRDACSDACSFLARGTAVFVSRPRMPRALPRGEQQPEHRQPALISLPTTGHHCASRSQWSTSGGGGDWRGPELAGVMCVGASAHTLNARK